MTTKKPGTAQDGAIAQRMQPMPGKKAVPTTLAPTTKPVAPAPAASKSK
jgi:hypothetical protein